MSPPKVVSPSLDMFFSFTNFPAIYIYIYKSGVPETPQPSSCRRINVIDEEISSKTEMDELIKMFKESQNQKFQEFFIPKKPLKLTIFTLGQPFLICNMKKEINILKPLIPTVSFINGI